MIRLHAGAAELVVDPERGGRWASLVVHGRDLVVRSGPDLGPMAWGSYPMVPFAGRIRRGRFEFDGETIQLPADFGGHAIHGWGYLGGWTVESSTEHRVELSFAFTDPWPFGGTARQTWELTAAGATGTLSVTAGDRPMPAQLGWHPWFLKPDALEFSAGAMYRRDDDYIATAELVDVPDGPWDDCFCGVTQPVTLRWGDLELELRSDCDDWVVYDQPLHASCVEPQSGPPDGFTVSPHRLEPGETLSRRFDLTWRTGPSIAR